MYIPEPFALSDPARIAAVLRDYDFALLISAVEGRPPVATHLPFLYDSAAGPHGTLIAHMARANPHWRDFAPLAAAGGQVLAAFQGPHAYISPTAYAPGPAVPTWNYVAVHAYGTPRLLEAQAEVERGLARLVAAHEAGAPAPWSMAGQDEAFLARMMRGIVMFEIPLTRIEAKAKLSQNKRPADRRGVVAALGAQGHPGAAELAQWMVDLNDEG